MSRVIKFRAWYEFGKEMIPVTSLEFRNGDLSRIVTDVENVLDFMPDEGVLMQFTGLFDRLKVGIYEGDIVRLEDTAIGIIEYSGAEFIVRSGKDRIGLNDTAPQYVEIIGNIYETPELLPLEQYQQLTGNAMKPLVFYAQERAKREESEQ